MQKINNKDLFKTAIEFKPANINFDESISIKEKSICYLTNTELEHNITLTKKEIIKFICHMHEFDISIGTPHKSSSYIIGLAFQKQGFLDANFRRTTKELKDLDDKKEQFYLLQALKDIAPKHKLIIHEDKMKVVIDKLYLELKQRTSALVFFRSTYFESFIFETAIFLLYQGIKNCTTFLPSGKFLALTDPLSKTQDIIKRAFSLNKYITEILKSTNNTQKIQHIKNLCESMIKDILNNKNKILLQIQITGNINHAVYGILESFSTSTETTGIQLVLSNGGYGVNYHKPNQNSSGKKHAPVTQESNDFPWHNVPEWVFLLEEQTLLPEDFVHYKAIRITDINDKQSREAFCYYLMVCCSGNYLISEAKIPGEQFVSGIYDPKNTTIKFFQDESPPLPEKLEIINLEQIMPKQIMGNCTFHNAIYAICYAENLKQAQLCFIKNMLKVGIDRYFTPIFFTKALDTLKIRRKSIQAGSECQFKAVHEALYLLKASTTTLITRDSVVEYIGCPENKAKFSNRVVFSYQNAAYTFDDYLIEMANPNTPGDSFTLQVIAEIVDRSIIIIEPTVNASQLVEINIIHPPKMARLDIEQALILIFNGSDHYDVAETRGDSVFHNMVIKTNDPQQNRLSTMSHSFYKVRKYPKTQDTESSSTLISGPS